MKYDVRKLKGKLRELWLDSGLTQKELAKETRINEKTLNNALNPDSTNASDEPIYPDLKTLIKLCDYFDSDIDSLFGVLDYSKHDTKFICEYTGLTEDSVYILHTDKTVSDDISSGAIDLSGIDTTNMKKRCFGATVNDLLKNGSLLTLEEYLSCPPIHHISFTDFEGVEEKIDASEQYVSLNGLYPIDDLVMKQAILNKLKDCLDELIELSKDDPQPEP